jgi:phosphopantetheine adenylyltransferase
MPNEEHSYITAGMVREVARFGGRVDDFVPPTVARRVAEWREASKK